MRTWKTWLVERFGGHWRRPPTAPTLGNVYVVVSPEQVESALVLPGERRGTFAADGKAVRGARLELLTVFAHTSDMIVTRLPYDKGRELEALRAPS